MRQLQSEVFVGPFTLHMNTGSKHEYTNEDGPCQEFSIWSGIISIRVRKILSGIMQNWYAHYTTTSVCSVFLTVWLILETTQTLYALFCETKTQYSYNKSNLYNPMFVWVELSARDLACCKRIVKQ